MKRIFITLLLIVAAFSIFSIPVLAQDGGQNEIAVSALFIRQNPDFKTPNFKFDQSTDQIGVMFNYTRFLDDTNVGFNFEVAGSATGPKETSGNLVTATAGLILKARMAKVAPFIKINGGVARLAARNDLLKFDTSNAGFAVVAGGGLDFQVKSFFLRLPEVSYVGTRFQGQIVNHIRVGAGLGVSF